MNRTRPDHRAEPPASRRRRGGLWRFRGFSLLELVLVLALISVLGAIAWPRYAGSIARYRADAAARRIAADLAFAQTLARTSSTGRSVQFLVEAGAYDMPDPQNANTPGATLRVNLGDEPYRAALVQADFNGDGTIVFDGFGVADSGGSVTVGVGSAQKTVTVDASSGKIAIQ